MAQVTVEKTQNYLIVKIPLRAIKEGKAELAPRSRKIIDRAISLGISDIEAGRIFGPFSDVKSFRAALRANASK
jgi:hypothetical protein